MSREAQIDAVRVRRLNTGGDIFAPVRERDLARSEAAAALGRVGGRVNSPAQQAARRANVLGVRRPSVYRWVGETLERRTAGTWTALTAPYDAAAKQYLRRHAHD